MDKFAFSLLFDSLKTGCGVKIMSFDYEEFWGDFDTTAPTHDNRPGLQMASSAQDDSGHTGRF